MDFFTNTLTYWKIQFGDGVYSKSTFLLIAVGLATVILFYTLRFLLSKVKFPEVNARDVLINTISSEGIPVTVSDETFRNPYYDSLKKEIVLRDKTDFTTLIEGFHEAGHAVDFERRTYIQKINNSKVMGLLFLILSYFPHLTVALILSFDVLPSIKEVGSIVTSFLVIATLATLFSLTLLFEESVANIEAMKLIRKNFPEDKKTINWSRVTLFNGYLTYLVVSFFCMYGVFQGLLLL